MPTTEQVRELTLDTLEGARGRAEELVSSGAHGLAVAVGKARDHAPDIDLSAVEVPGVEDLVNQASSHKLRTTLIVSLVVLAILVVVRKATADHDEPVAPAS